MKPYELDREQRREYFCDIHGNTLAVTEKIWHEAQKKLLEYLNSNRIEMATTEKYGYPIWETQIRFESPFWQSLLKDFGIKDA